MRQSDRLSLSVQTMAKLTKLSASCCDLRFIYDYNFCKFLSSVAMTRVQGSRLRQVPAVIFAGSQGQSWTTSQKSWCAALCHWLGSAQLVLFRAYPRCMVPIAWICMLLIFTRYVRPPLCYYFYFT